MDDQDRLTSYAGATYQYTAHGDLQREIVGTDTTEYTYDALGNLMRVELPTGTVIGYLLDAMNRRIGKTVNDTLVKAWLYQGQLTPVAELDGSGNVVSRFVYATGVNVPDYVVRGDSTYRIIRDHLGSVRVVVNVSSGTIAQRVSYDEFGIETENTNPGWQPFGYAGGLTDSQTGLVRFGARDYDPVVGRWTAKDPIGFAGGAFSLYDYTENDPVNLFDPEGLDAVYLHFDFYPITAFGDLKLPLGHAGVLTWDKNGQTRYYEYGRYGNDFGSVRGRVVPDLEIDKNGRPTPESWEALMEAVKEIGKGYHVSYKHDSRANFADVVRYAQGIMNNPNRRPYHWLTNNCKTFAWNAVRAGGGDFSDGVGSR